MAWGTLQISDSLATLLNAEGRTVNEFGIAETWALVQKDLSYHNDLVNQQLIPSFCYRTDATEMVYGGQADMTVEEIDEYGRPDTQKNQFATTLGFKLSSYGRSVGWTWDLFQEIGAAEFAEQYVALRDADIKGIKYNIMQRFFDPTNNLTYQDVKIDNKQLRLRAFINADGEQVMTGPQSQTFDPTTHTHFMGTASFGAADVTALITNVLEHGRKGKLKLYINLAQDATIRTFTGPNQFSALVDSRIRQPLTASFANTGYLDLDTPEDRMIGIFGAAEVWVKPWVPAGYIACVDEGAGKMKPLVYRTRKNGALSDFGPRGKVRSEAFPLYAETMARDYGISVWQRHMVAVLDTTHSSYTAPTII